MEKDAVCSLAGNANLPKFDPWFSYPNIFQHTVLSDPSHQTENSYIIVQMFFEGFWSKMKLYCSSAVRCGCLHNELIVRSFHNEHKLLPRALGLVWQMKSESEMVEMAVMRAEKKQTELMEPTVRWGAQELLSSSSSSSIGSSIL